MASNRSSLQRYCDQENRRHVEHLDMGLRWEVGLDLGLGYIEKHLNMGLRLGLGLDLGLGLRLELGLDLDVGLRLELGLGYTEKKKGKHLTVILTRIPAMASLKQQVHSKSLV